MKETLSTGVFNLTFSEETLSCVSLMTKIHQKTSLNKIYLGIKMLFTVTYGDKHIMMNN